MKIIYIAPMLHPVGGLERTLTDKANYLVNKGHDVMFLTYMQGGEKVYYDLDSRVRQCDIACPFFSLYRFPAYARISHYLKLKQQFRERMKEVIDGFKPDTIVITIPNTEDFIHDMVKVANHVRVVVESHLAMQYHLSRKPFFERLLYRLTPPIKAIRKANLLVALTQRDAHSWHKRRVPHVAVVPNPSTYYASDIGHVEKKEGRIIAVGRLTDQKRFDRMIDAFSLIASQHPTWSLDIYGEGKLHDTLLEQIGRLGLSGRVRLNAPSHDIISEYKRSQFLALSSDYEGFGLVIIEAMACGIPVVSTDCPCGPSEIITDGVTGLLAKMDVKSLADKMEWMITHDKEREQMGVKAHEASARYQIDMVMQEWENVYFPE